MIGTQGSDLCSTQAHNNSCAQYGQVIGRQSRYLLGIKSRNLLGGQHRGLLSGQCHDLIGTQLSYLSRRHSAELLAGQGCNLIRCQQRHDGGRQGSNGLAADLYQIFSFKRADGSRADGSDLQCAHFSKLLCRQRNHLACRQFSHLCAGHIVDLIGRQSSNLPFISRQ